MNIAPVLKYPGAKWRLAEWIVSHCPPHTAYLEPFFGSGAVLFNKPPSKIETVNDINGDVVNLFRVIRERPEELAAMIEMTPWARDEYYASYEHAAGGGDPLEDARRFLVRCWQAHGSRINSRAGWAHDRAKNQSNKKAALWAKLPYRIIAIAERLKRVQIEHRTALEVIKLYNHQECLIYADPPYPLKTRSGAFYANEMTDADHIELLEALDKHPGSVVLSGYACELYDNRLSHWERHEIAAQAEYGRKRTEVLWLNRRATEGQLKLFR